MKTFEITSVEELPKGKVRFWAVWCGVELHQDYVDGIPTSSSFVDESDSAIKFQGLLKPFYLDYMASKLK